MKTMSIIRNVVAASCAAALLSATAPSSHGAGLLIADGGFGGVLEIKEHQVEVTINNGMAVTRVTQIFLNKENRQVEALYTFPAPKGASVANFSMWINGKEMVGEVLEKKKAREIYDSYKRIRQDPGLLEQVDYKTFEMRIFPIAPSAEQRVQITYYQELDVDHDWATYVYPLATTTRREFNDKTTGKFSFNIHAKSAIPLRAVESPSHGQDMVVARHTDEYYQAGLEMNEGSLARDIVLSFNLDRPQSGFDLITSKQPGEDGYFCLTLTPGDDLDKMEGGMDYVFVIDISGSMADDGKLLLSKDSVGTFLQELTPEDRFEIITFNMQPNLAFQQLRPASKENIESGLEHLKAQSARGGTELASAMSTAFKYSAPDRPLNVVVFSDGLTESQDRATLIQLSQTRPGNSRVFCIGVGNDVNRPMLEQVAGQTGGLAAFISRGDNFARQAKAFRRKLTRPAATGLEIRIQGLSVYDLEPQQLPNLYHGSPVRLYGRYQGSGPAEIKLRASVNGRELSQSVTLQFPETATDNPELERMWAWRRVDGLLKTGDAKGRRQEVMNEVVRLGELYSIATEYTSFLVLENDAEYQRWKLARANLRRLEKDRNAHAAVQKHFESLRSKALSHLGPESVATPALASAPATPVSPPVQVAANQPSPTPGSAPPQPAPRRSGNISFGGGGGAVGPLFVLLSLLWRRYHGQGRQGE